MQIVKKETALSRCLLISLALAAILNLPALGELLDVRIVGRGVLMIPAIGLDYMVTFFHEIGHTIANWLFGYTALPTFDFQNGGGMTYTLSERSRILQGVFMLAIIAGNFWLFIHKEYGWLKISVPILLFYLVISFTQGHEAVIAFMGHGAEMAVAGFCLWRGCLNKTVNAVERWLNLVLGFYIVLRDTILLGGLIHSDIARMAYSMQKGGEIQGDIDRIADLLNMSTVSAAGLALGFMAVVLTITAYAVCRSRAATDIIV